MNKNLTIPGVAAIVALIIGFGAGYYAPHRNAATGARAMLTERAGAGGFGMRGGVNGASVLTGTIAKTGSGSLTLTTRNGNSQVILVTPDTTVMKSTTGTISDVSIGADVLIAGTVNSDGSVSAQTITLRPAGSPTYGGGANAPMIPVQAPSAQ